GDESLKICCKRYPSSNFFAPDRRKCKYLASREVLTEAMKITVVFGESSMRIVYRVGLAVLLCLFGGAALYAQLTSATLTGQVTDSSKAVVPGASVVATETETGTAYQAVTNEQGNYVLPNLLPGTYNVTVSMNGFASSTQRNLTVTVGAHQTLDVTLNVGSVSQSVSVNATGTSVEVQTPTVSTSISNTM